MPQGICVGFTLSMSVSKPSKSARKREYLALQSLGEKLIGLNADQLANIPLDERLLDAVMRAKSMKAHGALRRQKLLIGKLMRDIDPEPIRAALEEIGRDERLARDLFRDSERWRDRIAAEGADGLSEFFGLIGSENRDLQEQSRAHDAATDDRTRRLIRRRIFSEVHRELARKLHRHPG